METKKRSRADELADLVGRRLEESADGYALARDAHYSRFHFQRHDRSCGELLGLPAYGSHRAFEYFGIEDFGSGDPIEWQRTQA